MCYLFLQDFKLCINEIILFVIFCAFLFLMVHSSESTGCCGLLKQLLYITPLYAYTTIYLHFLLLIKIAVVPNFFSIQNNIIHLLQLMYIRCLVRNIIVDSLYQIMAKSFSKLLGQFMFLCAENKRSFYPTFSPKHKISHLNQFSENGIFHFGFSFSHPHCLYVGHLFICFRKRKKKKN